jgi:hypothetical protein
MVIWKQCPFFLESPGSTILPLLERPSELASRITLHRVKTYLGSFGGPTLKPIYIWSNSKEALVAVYRPAVHMENPAEASLCIISSVVMPRNKVADFAK